MNDQFKQLTQNMQLYLFLSYLVVGRNLISLPVPNTVYFIYSQIQTQTLPFSRSCHAYKHTYTFTMHTLLGPNMIYTRIPYMTDVQIHTL